MNNLIVKEQRVDGSWFILYINLRYTLKKKTMAKLVCFLTFYLTKLKQIKFQVYTLAQQVGRENT